MTAFIAKFLEYLIEMVILVALAYIGTLTGKKMRERKEEKAASYRPQINQGRR